MSKRLEEFKSPEGLVTVTKHALSDDANPLEFCNHIQDGWIYWRDLEAQIKDTALNALAGAGFSSAADVPADISPATIAGAAIRVLHGMDRVQFFIDRKEAERAATHAVVLMNAYSLMLTLSIERPIAKGQAKIAIGPVLTQKKKEKAAARYPLIQKAAVGIWKRHPRWLKGAVAEEIVRLKKGQGLKAGSIRKLIKKPT